MFGRKMLSLVMALGVLMLSACASAPMEADYQPGGSAERAGGTGGRMIAYSADIEVEVGSLDAIGERVDSIVKAAKGYVGYSQKTDDRYTATLRVPPGQLEQALDRIEELGTLISRNVQTKDVTDQYIDYDAKLKNLEAMRDRFRELLKRADDVKDAIRVEEELNRVQSEIDSLKGKLQALKKSVAYADVEVTLRQKRVYGPLGYVFYGIGWGLKKLFVIK